MTEKEKQQTETTNKQAKEKALLEELFATEGWNEIVVPYLQSRKDSCLAQILNTSISGEELELARCRLVAATELFDFAKGKLQAVDSALKSKANRTKQKTNTD